MFLVVLQQVEGNKWLFWADPLQAHTQQYDQRKALLPQLVPWIKKIKD